MKFVRQIFAVLGRQKRGIEGTACAEVWPLYKHCLGPNKSCLFYWQRLFAASSGQYRLAPRGYA
jgi:hypothetical protein